eukprot:5716904-Prymnesium_polylepis.1
MYISSLCDRAENAYTRTPREGSWRFFESTSTREHTAAHNRNNTAAERRRCPTVHRSAPLITLD